MAIKHPSTVGEPVKITAATWFNEHLPLIVKAQPDLARRVNASLVFKVSGKNGGEWTVDLTKQKVNKGAKYPADLIMEMGSGDFEALLTGKLDAGQAMQNGKIEVKGRIEVLRAFAALLKPADA
ncbi:MAG: SCP2 sterol-binding domain-containing protein [Deltaproteobacteria bacterium]|nr:SCP2 sterol-binding domain-containing protein [Deltaproteobacteria bacterium]